MRVLHDGPLAAASTAPIEIVELNGPCSVAVVSVIVPAYNNRRYLHDLLTGVGPQLGDQAELIVVDDGSTDGSFEFLVPEARALGVSGRIIRLPSNRGRSFARNVGVVHARAQFIAFTDSDCIPTPGWLKAGLARVTELSIGVVQGGTRADPRKSAPLFSHYIEISAFDGSFSTCNVFYRKQAIVDAGGFDPAVVYWEDLDLGWRVCRAGWTAAFASDAIVHHQIVDLSPVVWLGWPRHLAYMPDKVAAYPEYRRYLFMGIWTHWFNALLELALIALVASVFNRRWLLLALPYLTFLPQRYGLQGRWPVAKAAFHVGWDLVSVWVLLTSSFRRRTLVL
jgi:glycosyltransferase involved in cell wall biosynthesis